MKSEVTIAAEMRLWLEMADEEDEASFVALVDEAIARNDNDWIKFLMSDNGLMINYIDGKY